MSRARRHDAATAAPDIAEEPRARPSPGKRTRTERLAAAAPQGRGIEPPRTPAPAIDVPACLYDDLFGLDHGDAGEEPASHPLLAKSTWSADDVRLDQLASPHLGTGLAGDLRTRASGGAVDFGANPQAPGKAAVAEAAASVPGDARFVGDQLIVRGGDIAAALADSASLAELGGTLGRDLPFERYRARVDGDHVSIEGKLNPWVKIIDGKIKLISRARGNDEPNARWEWFEDQDVAQHVGEHDLTSAPLALDTPLYESPNAYGTRCREAGHAPELFRALRSEGKNMKQSDGELFKEVANSGERTQKCQDLKNWPPNTPISAVNPQANKSIAQHVSGTETETQYISTTKDLERACIVSVFSYAGSGGLGELRQIERWGTVAQIDPSAMPDDARIYDLAEKQPFFGGIREGHTQGDVKKMAARDAEVLLENAIPGGAIVKVHSVDDIFKLLWGGDPVYFRTSFMDLYWRVPFGKASSLKERRCVDVVKASGLWNAFRDAVAHYKYEDIIATLGDFDAREAFREEFGAQHDAKRRKVG
jgi:hypothetical protein